MEPEGVRSKAYANPPEVHSQDVERLRNAHSARRPGRFVRARREGAACHNRRVAPRNRAHRPRAARSRVAALAVALAVVACGTAPTTAPSLAPTSAPTPSAVPSPSLAPTPAPSVDNAAVYAQIESDVQAIRGLRAKSTVEPKVVDPAAMTKVITDELARGTPPAIEQATERAFKALGLLAPDASLKQLYLQLLTSQVAGLYDPTAKTLYVLSRQGALGPVERVTFSHEFDHALQDQNFGLQKLQVDAIGEGDRSLARLALPEGDATLLMSLWAQQHLTPAETIQLLAESQDPEQTRTLAAMPSILRETLLFPYTTGLQFVLGLQASGGWTAVDAAYAKLPDSTEQLLHPEKYASHEAVLPINIPADLAKRLGTGWSVPLTDSLGEFQLRIWLRDVGKMTEAAATAAAAGWGGDRIVLANGPSGTWALAILSRWDTPADALEFRDAASATTAILAGTGEAAEVRRLGGAGVAALIGPDQAAVNRIVAAVGAGD